MQSAIVKFINSHLKKLEKNKKKKVAFKIDEVNSKAQLEKTSKKVKARSANLTHIAAMLKEVHSSMQHRQETIDTKKLFKFQH